MVPHLNLYQLKRKSRTSREDLYMHVLHSIQRFIQNESYTYPLNSKPLAFCFQTTPFMTRESGYRKG